MSEDQNITMTYLKRWPNSKRAQSLRGKRVLIYSGEHCAWWRPERAGYCREFTGAGIYTFEDAWSATSHCGPEKMISFRMFEGYEPDERIVMGDEARRLRAGLAAANARAERLEGVLRKMDAALDHALREHGGFAIRGLAERLMQEARAAAKEAIKP